MILQFSFRHTRYACCLALLFISQASIAQTPSPNPSPSPQSRTTPKAERNFLKNILRDQKAIWTSPVRWEADDARWLVPLGVGTAALIATDRRTADWMAKYDAQPESRIISFAGDTYSAGAVAATFYLVGRAKHDPRARETGVLAAQALINGELVTLGLKAVTQRVRPKGGAERGEFFEGGRSFPSGHSIQAWSVATVIAHEYSDHRMVQIAAYGAAAAISMSRFTGHKHFLSDILVGSAIGYGIGRYVYQTHHVKAAASGTDEEESREDSRQWPIIAPQYSRSARLYGVRAVWQF